MADPQDWLPSSVLGSSHQAGEVDKPLHDPAPQAMDGNRMVAWIMISLRHPAEGQMPRKPWSRTGEVQPVHRVGRYEHSQQFWLYLHRKFWKSKVARIRTYNLRGYR